MHEEAFSFQSLLLVTLLAAGVPLLLGRFRQLRLPVVVGEILAGLVVGKSGLGLVEEDLWLAFLSTLGFSYLMFLSGLEVDFDAVTTQIRRTLLPPILVAVVAPVELEPRLGQSEAVRTPVGPQRLSRRGTGGAYGRGI